MDYKDYERGHSEEGFWFRAKHELIKTMLSNTPTKKSKSAPKILNIGAGIGDDLKIINKFGEVYVVDIDKRAIKLVPKKLCYEKKVGDACKLPYKDNTFDMVLLYDVLEHIKNHKKAISEIHRVLKKGGFFLFAVPAFQSIYSKHDVALGHERRYSKKQLKKLLRKFNKVQLNYWNGFLFPGVAIFRIIKRSSKPSVDKLNAPKIVQDLLFAVLNSENRLLKHGISLPFGLSLIGKCKK